MLLIILCCCFFSSFIYYTSFSSFFFAPPSPYGTIFACRMCAYLLLNSIEIYNLLVGNSYSLLFWVYFMFGLAQFFILIISVPYAVYMIILLWVYERLCICVFNTALFEPRREKIGLRGFRQGLTKTGLYGHIIWLET